MTQGSPVDYETQLLKALKAAFASNPRVRGVYDRDRSADMQLHAAASCGNTPKVWLLIDNGEDPDAEIDGWTSLHIATAKGHTDTVRALIKAGAAPNPKSPYGITPLHVAAYRGRTKIACALINACAKLNARDKDGNTPLHIAVRNGHAKTAQLLRDAIADNIA